jgi:hypothetical protein
MKFNLTTAGNFYSDPEQIRKLEALGFGFVLEVEDKTSLFSEGDKYLSSGETEIEINTLEELINFSKEWGKLVVSEGELEIYDDYRE